MSAYYLARYGVRFQRCDCGGRVRVHIERGVGVPYFVAATCRRCGAGIAVAGSSRRAAVITVCDSWNEMVQSPLDWDNWSDDE